MATTQITQMCECGLTGTNVCHPVAGTQATDDQHGTPHGVSILLVGFGHDGRIEVIDLEVEFVDPLTLLADSLRDDMIHRIPDPLGGLGPFSRPGDVYAHPPNTDRFGREERL